MKSCPFSSLIKNQKGTVSIMSKKEKSSFPEKQGEKISDSQVSLHFQKLSAGKVGTQLKFVGLNEDDVENLTHLRPIFEQNSHKIVDAFYSKLQEIPELTQIILHHSSLDRLKKTLRQYLIDMTLGQIGERYAERRRMIGNVHNKIGLFPEWYIGAYTIIQNEVLRMLINELDNIEDIKKYYLSFQKLCSFDMQIAIETYIMSYTSSMMKLNEIEALQKQLNESATTLAANAEETTSSIVDKERLVSTLLEEIDSIYVSSNEMIQQVEDGKGDVLTALSKVDGVVDLIDNTKRLTQELSESSSQIGEVVKGIRGISKQTNILSLNAAIEAARAGVHGKGFSIVAQEVRHLAHQTEKALDDIQSQITAVQNTVEKFEDSFQSIVKETALFREINKKIIEILESSVESVKWSNSKIDKFGKTVNDFNKTFNEITHASYQIATMAEQLSNLNNELSEKF